LTETDFWNLAPVEHRALVKQWKENKNSMALGSAHLASLVVNFLRDKSTPAVSAADFLPFPPPRPRLSEAETEAFLDHFFGTKKPFNGVTH